MQKIPTKAFFTKFETLTYKRAQSIVHDDLEVFRREFYESLNIDCRILAEKNVRNFVKLQRLINLTPVRFRLLCKDIVTTKLFFENISSIFILVESLNLNFEHLKTLFQDSISMYCCHLDTLLKLKANFSFCFEDFLKITNINYLENIEIFMNFFEISKEKWNKLKISKVANINIIIAELTHFISVQRHFRFDVCSVLNFNEEKFRRIFKNTYHKLHEAMILKMSFDNFVSFYGIISYEHYNADSCKKIIDYLKITFDDFIKFIEQKKCLSSCTDSLLRVIRYFKISFKTIVDEDLRLIEIFANLGIKLIKIFKTLKIYSYKEVRAIDHDILTSISPYNEIEYFFSHYNIKGNFIHFLNPLFLKKVFCEKCKASRFFGMFQQFTCNECKTSRLFEMFQLTLDQLMRLGSTCISFLHNYDDLMYSSGSQRENPELTALPYLFSNKIPFLSFKIWTRRPDIIKYTIINRFSKCNSFSNDFEDFLEDMTKNWKKIIVHKRIKKDKNLKWRYEKWYQKKYVNYKNKY